MKVDDVDLEQAVLTIHAPPTAAGGRRLRRRTPAAVDNPLGCTNLQFLIAYDMPASELAYRLSLGAAESIDAYKNEYLNNLQSVWPRISDRALLRAEIVERTWGRAEDLLRFSLIFNDLSFLSIYGSHAGTMTVFKPESYEKLFGSSEVSIRVIGKAAEEILAYGTEKPTGAIGFSWPGGAAAENRIADLAPLIETGRVLLQPRRLVFVRLGKNPQGTHNWHGVPAELDNPLGAWHSGAESQHEARPIRIIESEDSLPNDALFKMTVPYIKSIPLRELSQIVLDEEAILSEFRAALKKMAREVGGDISQEVHDDLIRPKLDYIDRRFRQIVATRRLRIAGATVATAAVAFQVVVTGGATLPAVLGAGGLGWITKEIADLKDDVAKLAEDPLYFLWKCRRAARSRPSR